MNDSLKREALLRSCQRVLLQILVDGAPIVTADDIRRKIALPAGVNPKTFGSVPTPLSDAGIIMRIGHVQTERPIAHKRHISVWKLRDRQAAEAWLAAHPEITPPEKPEHQGDLFASELEAASHD